MTNRREYHRNYQRRKRAMQRLGLQAINLAESSAFALDSRKVAEIIEKEHGHLMRDIRRYVGVLDQHPDLDSASFFSPSTYVNENNQSYPSFLLTKQGCEMVANKMTGEKGILFTASYVSRFNEMEEIMQQAEKQPQTSTLLLGDFETQVKAAKHTADMIGADRTERLAMLAVIHEEHGLSARYLEVLNRKGVTL